MTMAVLRHPAVNSSMNLDAGPRPSTGSSTWAWPWTPTAACRSPTSRTSRTSPSPGWPRIVDIARRTRDKKIQPDEITVRDLGSGRLRYRDPPGVVSGAYGDSIAAIRRGVAFAVVEEAREARELGGPRGVW